MPALFSGGTEQNISRIQELGYDGVDLFVKDPASADTRRTLALLRQYGLGIGAVMPAALAGEGLYLGATEKSIREECVRRIGETVYFAADAGAMVSIGLVRGSKPRGEAMEAFERRFVESCVQVLGISQPLGVPLLLEPINRYEINTILSVNEGLDFIRRSGLLHKTHPFFGFQSSASRNGPPGHGPILPAPEKRRLYRLPMPGGSARQAGPGYVCGKRGGIFPSNDDLRRIPCGPLGVLHL